MDAALLIKNWLKSELAQPFPLLQVRLELPADWEPGKAPALCVFDDGGQLDKWPVATDPTIRITSWTTGRDLSYVHRTLGLLLTSRIPGVAKVKPGTAVIADRDSSNRGDVASFTVRTTLRTKSF